MNPHNLRHLAYTELDGGRLRDHQADGVALMATTLKTLCADPVGAGKTVQAAGLLAHLGEVGEVTPERPALVLTLGSQLARQTAAELSRFLPGLTVLPLAGHPGLASGAREHRKRETLNQPAHARVMAYTQWRTRGHLWEGSPSVLILDEVSALKGGGAEYASVLPVAEQAGRVHMFSATPYENDPVEMWVVYSLLDLPHLPDRREFERDFVAWKGRGANRRAVGWLLDVAAYCFCSLTEDHYFRRESALESLNRPRYTRVDWPAPLSPEQSQLMAAADRHNGLGRHQRQKKILTGKIGGPSARAVATVDLIGEIVARDPLGKGLVIAESLTELDAVAEGLTAHHIPWMQVQGATAKAERPGIIEDFRDDPTCPVLLGSRVLERGLNLQFCRYLVTVGLPDNPARLEQQVGRIVRHGSPYDEVTHFVILAECAYDREAAERVLRKEENAAMVV
jgi:superfamily II DNA or RNA helicase